MKVRVERRALADALSAVAPAIPHRPQVPILAAVELVAAHDTLTVRATDYRVAISRTITAEVGEGATVVVSGHRLRNVVSAFAAADVDLTLEGAAVVVGSGRSTYRIQTMDASQFPQMPPIAASAGRVDAEALTGALRRIQHASGGDEIASVCGIQIEGNDEGLALTATDRFAFATTRVAYTGPPFVARLLHSEALAAVKGLTGDVTLHPDDSRLGFSTPTAALVVSLIDAPYPNLSGVIARSGDGITFVTDRDYLIESVTRCGLALERNGSVIGVIATDGLTLTAHDEAADITEEVEAIGATGEDRFGFNPDYLAKLLNGVSESVVEVALPSLNTGAMRVTGIDGERRSTDLHGLMTKRINR